MGYLALVMGALLAVASLNKDTGSNVTEWEQYKQLHGKIYETKEEDTMRHLMYRYSKQQLERFQSEPEAQTFEVALNHLADHSPYEIDQMNGFRLPKDERTGLSQVPTHAPEAQAFLDEILNDKSKDVPDELDWRKVPGRVSEVKDQKNCGSCWAFATTGTLEGQELVRPKYFNGTSLVGLSEQNLVDCVYKNGCMGGMVYRALEYISKQKGIDDEKSYPYRGDSYQCRFKKDNVVFSAAGFAVLPSGDEEKLKEVVAKFGPVSVGIDASNFWFRYYHSGIYMPRNCKNTPYGLNHAVLVVGYGTDSNGIDYWIVKNSWSKKWGNDGYFLLARNRGNMCGIATLATIPTF